MANEASVTVQATVLPDEISQILSGSMSVSLGSTNAGDKWYYQKTTVNTTTDEIILSGKSFVEADALAVDGTVTTVAAADTIKFLIIKNLDTTNYISVSLNGAASKAASEIKVSAGETMVITPNDTTQANLQAIADTATVDCVIAAIVNDAA